MAESDNRDTLAERVAELILASQRVVVFTGAGVSTESGLPDFRSPGGLWDRFYPDDFTYQKFISRPETRRLWWQLIYQGSLSREIKPNPAHYAIAELDRLGKLDSVITQNIDNLHQAAGVPDEKVFELHGNLRWSVCLDCGQRYPFEAVKSKLDAGQDAPRCEVCSGILKPGIVFFGEVLPEGVFEAAARHAEGADLLLVIGSTLIVHPAADIPARACRSGARLAIINLSPTPLDSKAAVLIRAKAGETMTRVMELLREKS
jgi:NAD-dependent deacetylase